MWSPEPFVRIRKQLYDLTLADLAEHPVWEFALDEEGEEGQDEATVRPFEADGALDPSDGMFVVRANFMLADGTQMVGYLTPPEDGEGGLGDLQPVIVTDRGQVGFWNGIVAPDEASLAEAYARIGKPADSVFPLRFQSAVQLQQATVDGTIDGFLYLEDIDGPTSIVR